MGKDMILHKGDAVEWLSTIKDNSVDAIFFDAPFYQNGEKGKDKIANYRCWIEKMAKHFSRILVEGGNVIYVNAPKYILATADIFLSLFEFRSQVPLIRRGSLRPAWMLGFRHNIILFLCKGDKKLHWNGARENHDKSHPTDVWDDIPYQNGYRSKFGWHPEAINLPVVERAVKLVASPGDTVIDPCMGSGTTAVVCMNNGINFMGNEIRDDYYRLACDRISNENNLFKTELDK